MSTLFLSIAIAGALISCVTVIVGILIYGPESINIFKWRRERKPKPEKPKSKWLDAVFNIQERQREAEWEEQQIQEMKDEKGRS
jgi:predicted RND superfamily exporter protein